MSRRKVFLDNNVWNMLVEHAELNVDELVKAYHAERIEIVGTMELHEEIIGTARRKPAKYNALRPVWRKLVGKRNLLQLKERHKSELTHGGTLSGALRYQSSTQHLGTRHLLNERAAIDQINDIVYGRKQQYKEKALGHKEQVRRELEASGQKPGVLPPTVTEDRIRQMAVETVQAGPEHGLPELDPADVAYERIPSLWLLCGVVAAKELRQSRYNMSVESSDHHDRLHAAAGAYFDFLVTDDKEYRATLGLVPGLPFEIMTPSEFACWLREGISE